MPEPRKPLSGKAYVKTASPGYKMTQEERHQAYLRFAELIAAGLSQTEAALQAGFGRNRKSAGVIGARLAARPDVIQMVANARAARPAPSVIEPIAAEVDYDWIVSKLRYEAECSESPAARVRALELLGRIKGIYAADKQEVTHIGTLFADVLPDEPDGPVIASIGPDTDDPDLA